MGKVVEKFRTIQDLLNEILSILDKYDPERKFKFPDEEIRRKFEELREKLRDYIVDIVCGNELDEAYKWRKILLETCEEVKRVLGLFDIVFSKELSSFLEDPRRHLKKKIFLYLHDLLRGKVSLEKFSLTAHAAITTSLKTNMRTMYQNWVFLSILRLLAYHGFSMAYPELGVLSLERHSKQKLGYIPPNAILTNQEGRALSFFIEAPRPITWEDTQDLERIWKLYTALRPDMLVYGGSIYNIVKLDSDPPILRPNVIIECKELADWYLRVRYMRGPLAKPLTAEEWRSKWLKGLRIGLAEALGIEVGELDKMIESRKTIKLKDEQIVILYKSIYKPDKMFVISRASTPCNVKRRLEDFGIEVIDNIGFDYRKLESVVEYLKNIAAKTTVGRRYDIEDLIRRLEVTISSRLGRDVDREIIVKALNVLVIENLERLCKIVEELIKEG